MRKGSHKAIPEAKPATPAEEYESIPDDKKLSPLVDILARICDACHEMDGHAEPWGTIRRDIERLK